VIRVQIICFECKQFIDTTVYSRKGTAIAAAFEGLHTLESCTQEEPLDGGQDQEGSGGGATNGGATDEGKPAAAAAGEHTDPRKVN
jgi:hypothetical protein